jgi:hypothetical protein
VTTRDSRGRFASMDELMRAVIDRDTVESTDPAPAGPPVAPAGSFDGGRSRGAALVEGPSMDEALSEAVHEARHGADVTIHVGEDDR